MVPGKPRLAIVDGRLSPARERAMDIVILVISWTLFVPPAHDVDIQPMPDIASCLQVAETVTRKVSDLEQKGVRAKLVARCVSVPTNMPI
jgi:hypothetical protein